MDIGPVDVAIIGFPGKQFNGAILPALVDLVRNGAIRLLDLMFVYMDGDGAVGSLKLGDIAERHGPVPLYEHSNGGLLDSDDADAVAVNLDMNSSVVLICWQTSWATTLVTVLQDSGAQLLDQVRIPRDAVRAASANASEN